MQSLASLRRRYDSERRPLAFDGLPRFAHDGLTLGRGTLLVQTNLGSDIDANRLVVLMAAAHRKTSGLALKHARRAIDHWRLGDAALAHIELAFTRLPRLKSDDDAFRLFLAETLLDGGLTPRELGRELGFDLEKYTRDQPRVPAGHGRESGEFGSGSGSSAEARTGPGVRFATEDTIAATTETAERSFLADVLPEIVQRLAQFAARFSTPTAILGALIIPTPNSGGVTRGTLPGAPDISYEHDGPAGTLRLTQTQADGADAVVVAQSRRGIYVDVATDEPLGRNFGEQLYLDLDTVVAALASRERGKPAATDDDEPRLCPAPTKDVGHGAKVHILDYEDDVHLRVNPLAPIPRGFAVRIVDPQTGQTQYPDDCFRYAGDLIDGDMKPGDFADAKGEEYSQLLSNPILAKSVMDGIVDVTERHLRAAQARGANLKVYFAEQDAADKVRNEFARHPQLRNVVVGYLPPSKPKPRVRSR